LCTSMPTYFLVLVIKGFLSGGVELSTQNLLQKGHLFIMRVQELRLSTPPLETAPGVSSEAMQ
jgi:hypothetical protein